MIYEVTRCDETAFGALEEAWRLAQARRLGLLPAAVCVEEVVHAGHEAIRHGAAHGTQELPALGVEEEGARARLA